MAARGNEVFEFWRRQIAAYPALLRMRDGLLSYQRSRKTLFAGFAPTGAVRAVEQLVGAGSTNPRNYPPEERNRRMHQGPPTGGVAHGSLVHKEIERLVKALWSAGTRPAPAMQTPDALAMLTALRERNLVPLASELRVGGISLRDRRHWGTRIDLVVVHLPNAGLPRDAPAFAFVELKSGRQNEDYGYQPNDAPVTMNRHLFANAYGNPSDRDQLQVCAAAAFAELPYKHMPSFVAQLRRASPGATLQHYLLRVSRGTHFGLVHEPWLRGMKVALLGPPTTGAFQREPRQRADEDSASEEEEDMDTGSAAAAAPRRSLRWGTAEERGDEL